MAILAKLASFLVGKGGLYLILSLGLAGGGWFASNQVSAYLERVELLKVENVQLTDDVNRLHQDITSIQDEYYTTLALLEERNNQYEILNRNWDNLENHLRENKDEAVEEWLNTRLPNSVVEWLLDAERVETGYTSANPED